MTRCQHCEHENDADAGVCEGCGAALAPGDVSMVAHHAHSRVSCPECGAVGDCKRAVELRGSWSWLVFLAGGLLAVVFRNAGRKKKYQCDRCGAIFSARTPASVLSLVIFWFLICPTLVFLLVMLLIFLFSLVT